MIDADSFKLGDALRVVGPTTELNCPCHFSPQQPLARVCGALLRIGDDQSIVYMGKPLAWKPPQHSSPSLDELSWVPGGGQYHGVTDRWDVNAFIETANRH